VYISNPNQRNDVTEVSTAKYFSNVTLMYNTKEITNTVTIFSTTGRQGVYA